ncbi:MAG: class I SAM-dependent methyltransferase [Rhodospirillaceae bacterium]|nr:class I SAM-dependent methyltransferase [Rhodospirillaceae bacterium]
MTEAAAVLRPGDFTPLAEAYSANRPGYAPDVRDSLLALFGRPAGSLTAADVGAGTGIWTRMLAGRVGRVIAVEPNAAMRRCAVMDCHGLGIDIRDGSAEDTGLPDQSVDLVTMASSFHWADFDRATAEFLRVLKPGGWFAALWNPRVIGETGLFRDIEDHIAQLKPGFVRVSSGNAPFTQTLADRLRRHGGFGEVVTLDGQHTEEQSRARYLGLWRSVSDVRTQLGPEKWAAFMDYVDFKTQDLDMLSVTYRTRAWCARKPG